MHTQTQEYFKGAQEGMGDNLRGPNLLATYAFL